MRTKILYFAWLREQVGHGEEWIELPAKIATVAELICFLSQRSRGHERAFAQPESVCVALDQHHAAHDDVLEGVGEVAFFPPVTGG